MSTPQTARTPEECVEALALTSINRPLGMVDWMHYGFALRYGGVSDFVEGDAELRHLDESAESLSKGLLAQTLPLLEARTWTAGTLLLRPLPHVLWPELSTVSRGRYLAGLSRHMRRAANPASIDILIGDQLGGVSTPAVFDVSSEILQRLSSVSLDAESAAEIGANAIHANRLDILRTILSCPNLPEGPVCRPGTHSHTQNRWEKQLSQHSTRVRDVLLEAAVRCHCPEAMRILLEHGANPDIPCWNLERSYQEWFSALSFAINSLWDSGGSEACHEMIELLLIFGADARGLECEGMNHPLMLALRGHHWDLVDRLLALGAKFEGGQDYKGEDCERKGRLIPAGHPLIGYSNEDLEWINRSIAPLLPLVEVWQVPLFYRGDGQGGRVTTFLNCVLNDEDLPMLRKYENLGLPTALTPTLIADILQWGNFDALCHLLRNSPNLPRVMFRIRRRKPDFGISSRQLWLCQADPYGSNVLPEFDTLGQTPLELPDGSRVYAHLDSVAVPGHCHGPVTEGCFWLEKISMDCYRRADCITPHCVRKIWRMEPIPTSDYATKDMIPLVKEFNGEFFFIGICLRQLSSQHMPPGWRLTVKAWQDGGSERRIREVFLERVEAQQATNSQQPKPLLQEDELKPYPREFWPFLRRLKNSTIGVTEESCRTNPDVLDIYSVWESQNKPDKDFQPDPRLLKWPMWPKVPVELRPYFYFDELFGNPTVTFKSRNDYEKAMVRKAVQWNNEWMTQSMKDAGIV